MTGRNKLLAAGDKLREMIVPDVLAQAVTAVGSVPLPGIPGIPGISGISGIPGMGGGGGSRKATARRERDRTEEARMETARNELDELVAAVCPLCEGCVVGLDRGFIKEEEDVGDWEV